MDIRAWPRVLIIVENVLSRLWIKLWIKVSCKWISGKLIILLTIYSHKEFLIPMISALICTSLEARRAILSTACMTVE